MHLYSCNVEKRTGWAESKEMILNVSPVKISIEGEEWARPSRSPRCLWAEALHEGGAEAHVCRPDEGTPAWAVSAFRLLSPSVLITVADPSEI